MNSHHHHHHGCHHPHITTTTSLPCSYMYVLCYRQDQSNKFNLESPFVWNSNLADSSSLLQVIFLFRKSYKTLFHSFPLWIFRNLSSLQRKTKKVKVAQESQKEVLQKHLCSGVSTRSTNQGPALFMGMAHLVEHRHQAHLSHLGVMGFMFEVTP